MRLRGVLFWVSVLYFAEGFPFGLAYDVWPVYFRVHGVSLREIGLMALLFLPYTLKPAWAPLVDRMGSRQAWVTACELGLAALCLAMLVIDPTRTDWVLWSVLLGFTLLSATQDISIDAFAVDVSTPKTSGLINSTRVSLYRVALVFAGGVLLFLADRSWFGWDGVWWLSAAICVGFAGFVFISPRVARDRATDVSDEDQAPAVPLLYRVGLVTVAGGTVFMAWRSSWSGWWLGVAVIAGTVAIVSFLSPQLLRWLLRREMLPVVAFVLLYKVGDNTLGRMVKPFWVDSGMSTSEIGAVSAFLGTWLTIAGAWVGGWFVARRGVFQALLWMGIAQLISNFGYVTVAALELPLGDASLFGLSFGPFQAAIYLASIVESFAQGLGTTAFLSFLMNLCDPAHAATQYALLSAAFALSRDVAGAFSGIGAETLGYTGYFLLTASLALPALLLLPFLRARVHEESAVEGEEPEPG